MLPLFFRSATVFPCTTRLAPLVPASAFTLSTALVSLLTDCRAHRLAFDFSCESPHILIGAGNYILVVRSGIVFCTASKFFGPQECRPAADLQRICADGERSEKLSASERGAPVQGSSRRREYTVW